jgi:HlyD family secretion protein
VSHYNSPDSDELSEVWLLAVECFYYPWWEFMAQSTIDVDTAPQNPKRKFPLRWLIPIVLIGVVGVGLWRLFLSPAVESSLKLSGRVEADETDIGAKVGGRIKTISVHEGDLVKAGQLVVEISDEEVPEQLRAAAAQAAAARQDERQARLDIDVAQSRIQEAQANLQQSRGDAQGRVAQAQSNVSSARGKLAEAQAQVEQAQAQIVQSNAQLEQAKAQWRQAIASLKRAKIRRDRFAKLLAKGAVSQDQFDQIQTNLDTAQATVDNAQAAIGTADAGVATAQSTKAARISAVSAAQDQIAANQGGLVQTQSTEMNPTIRNSQLETLRQQKEQAYARLASAQAKVKNAAAAQDQVQKRLDSLQIKSPIDGIVQSRPVEPGAVVATGKTLLTVINPQALYLRGFIPEGEIGNIHVGMKAKVFLDSNDKTPLTATVMSVDTKASFTPENVYFKNDRVRQVFGVKLAISQTSNPLAKPGMPADAEILLK